MIARKQAEELILGVSRVPAFGPVILFGAGGVAVEVMDDTAIALPPLDDVLAGDLIDRTRIGRLLAGYRDRKPANRRAIGLALIGLSQMIIDFPCIASVDINPLLADSEGVIALDARIEIKPHDIERVGPNADLVIRPYPSWLGNGRRTWESGLSFETDQTEGCFTLSSLSCKAVARRHPLAFPRTAKKLSGPDAAPAHPTRL